MSPKELAGRITRMGPQELLRLGADLIDKAERGKPALIKTALMITKIAEQQLRRLS